MARLRQALSGDWRAASLAAPASWLLLAFADRRGQLLIEVLRHFQVMLERGQRLAGPVLQVGIVAALGIALEQVDGVLMGADLHRVELGTEVVAAGAFELVELALVRAVEGRWQFGLQLAA